MLRYYAFFKEPVAPSGDTRVESERVRQFVVYYYLENNTIQVRRGATRSSGFGAVARALVVLGREEREAPPRRATSTARAKQVFEPRIENSGLRGGNFVSRSALVNPATGAPFAESDLVVSADLQMSGRVLRV